MNIDLFGVDRLYILINYEETENTEIQKLVTLFMLSIYWFLREDFC